MGGVHVLFTIWLSMFVVSVEGENNNNDALHVIRKLELKQLETENVVRALQESTKHQEEHMHRLESRLKKETQNNMKLRKQFKSMQRTIFTLTSNQGRRTGGYSRASGQSIEPNTIVNYMKSAKPSSVTQTNASYYSNGSERMDDTAIHYGEILNDVVLSYEGPGNIHNNIKASLTGNVKTKNYTSHHSNKKKRGKLSSRQAGEGGVAFSVYLDHSVTFGNKQATKFNKVITNEGDGYNVHTGVFTCPMAGMYFFSFSVASGGVAEADARLMVNSVYQLTAATEGDTPADDEQGSNSAVVRLNQGDVVWIDGFRQIYSTPEFRVTSFTGFYLFP